MWFKLEIEDSWRSDKVPALQGAPGTRKPSLGGAGQSDRLREREPVWVTGLKQGGRRPWFPDPGSPPVAADWAPQGSPTDLHGLQELGLPPQLTSPWRKLRAALMTLGRGQWAQARGSECGGGD